MKIIKKFVQLILLLALFSINSPLITAATVNITARFTPSIDNPNDNKFVNTTPPGGYCESWPQYCDENKNIFSIATPLTFRASYPIPANSEPRQSMYFRLPGAPRKIQVINRETGHSANVEFRLTIFSARYSQSGDSNTWIGGSFDIPPSPCSKVANSWGLAQWYSFIWRWPGQDTACYKISSEEKNEPTRIYNVSFGYELTTPDPLKMESGVYEGSLRATVGPYADIDFGDNFLVENGNDSLTFNFALSVNHELKLTPDKPNPEVTLQPCSPGKICTEAEGMMNWERARITNITPQAMTGQTSFRLTSSGSFTVFLKCEFQSGEHCGIKSEKSAQVVPVTTLLTLENNVINNNGSNVERQRLYVGKNLSRNVFLTQSFGQERPGTIDFQINQNDINQMLTTRPDTYSGLVTVVFDPLIH